MRNVYFRVLKIDIRHIFSKTIIMLMMFFLFLPCSVKREVKNGLNIPVASLESPVKNNKTTHCQTFTKKSAPRVSVTCQQIDLQKHLHNCFLAFHQVDIFHADTAGLADSEIFTPVPIYILLEHYLI